MRINLFMLMMLLSWHTAWAQTPPSGAVRGKWLAAGGTVTFPRRMIKLSPFRAFKTSSEIIRLAVMMYARFPRHHRNCSKITFDYL